MGPRAARASASLSLRGAGAVIRPVFLSFLEICNPMHALSLPTWWIHVASVIEWILAVIAVEHYGRRRAEPGWRLLALAMLPALVSAMAACLWHLHDNSPALQWLVVVQAGTTVLGNGAMAWAAWRLLPAAGR